MKITLETRFDKGDRVWFALGQPGDYGTVTDVVVTRSEFTESVHVEYRVKFDSNDVFDRIVGAYALVRI